MTKKTFPFQPASRDSRVGQWTLVFLPLLFVGLTVAQFAATRNFSAPLLIGDRKDAAFDLWSLQHFCAGILLSALLMRTALVSATSRSFFLFGVFLAVCWEAAELAMEAGWFGRAISNWKDGYEHWSNRLLGDPLMVSLGSLLGRRYRHAWKFVLLPAAIWLVANVTSSSSMSIQRRLFENPTRN